MEPKIILIFIIINIVKIKICNPLLKVEGGEVQEIAINQVRRLVNLVPAMSRDKLFTTTEAPQELGKPIG